MTGIKKPPVHFRTEGKKEYYEYTGNDGFLVVKYKMPEFKTATIRI